jgi:IclR family pca regulon transcriptional regulator
MGKVMLADLEPDELQKVLAEPSRSGVVPRSTLEGPDLDRVLREVRAQGWALTDEQLASGVRSVAAPLRDGSGRVVAAMNVTVHAAETSVDTLREKYLPMLLETAGRVSADFALRDALPRVVADGGRA